ncbi:lysin motif receptor-like kinase (LysM-RLK) [Chara braunii]|uniref:Lysin motif receptor-like kinase (LysM-RLK) n=1 Tax=Chara braunii TaxID=69332 RepID=A0A388KNI4_CHABU|nr:lysin motif receptor-like kinase (LysM-RLK) [Chara braunii]|eukprot:GBG71568.1 lysin motif receptor-like kinase (LysM-RLK) [Chara braunii]
MSQRHHDTVLWSAVRRNASLPAPVFAADFVHLLWAEGWIAVHLRDGLWFGVVVAFKTTKLTCEQVCQQHRAEQSRAEQNRADPDRSSSMMESDVRRAATAVECVDCHHRNNGVAAKPSLSQASGTSTSSSACVPPAYWGLFLAFVQALLAGRTGKIGGGVAGSRGPTTPVLMMRCRPTAALGWLVLLWLCSGHQSLCIPAACAFACSTEDSSCQAYAVYVVSVGDRLEDICSRFQVTFADISAVNPVCNFTLHPGQNLLIPLSCLCNDEGFFQASIQHVVRDDQTLHEVASTSFHNLTTAEDIADASRINTLQSVHAGQSLRIPISCGCNASSLSWLRAPSYLTYVLQQGDTIDSVANTFGSDNQTIQKSNGGAGGVLQLRPGIKLIIPSNWTLPNVRSQDRPPMVPRNKAEGSESPPLEPASKPGSGNPSETAHTSLMGGSGVNAGSDPNPKSSHSDGNQFPIAMVVGVLAGAAVVFLIAAVAAVICLAQRAGKPGGDNWTDVDKWGWADWREWSRGSGRWGRFSRGSGNSRGSFGGRGWRGTSIPGTAVRQQASSGVMRSSGSTLGGVPASLRTSGTAPDLLGLRGMDDVNRLGGSQLDRQPGRGSLSAFGVEDPARLIVFPYKELLKATGRFNEVNKIGEGAYGSVYYARVRGRDAAVKRLKSVKEKEFQSELEMMCRVHHRHLLELLGYCTEHCLILVHEYAEGGALKKHLHSPTTNGFSPLPWRSRVQIAVDVASALEYLHEHTRPSYVHRDIKSSNILLDKDMRAKVADFGLIRLMGCEEGKGSMVSTGLVGTVGYMAPEYLKWGHVSTKADVYSFGVVLLELISGQEALSSTIDSHSSTVQIIGGGGWRHHRQSDHIGGSGSMVVSETSGSFLESSGGGSESQSVSESFANVLVKRKLEKGKPEREREPPSASGAVVAAQPTTPFENDPRNVAQHESPSGAASRWGNSDGSLGSPSDGTGAVANAVPSCRSDSSPNPTGKILSVNGKMLRLHGLMVEIVPEGDTFACKPVRVQQQQPVTSVTGCGEPDPVDDDPSTTTPLMPEGSPSSDSKSGSTSRRTRKGGFLMGDKGVGKGSSSQGSGKGREKAGNVEVQGENSDAAAGGEARGEIQEEKSSKLSKSNSSRSKRTARGSTSQSAHSKSKGGLRKTRGRHGKQEKAVDFSSSLDVGASVGRSWPRGVVQRKSLAEWIVPAFKCLGSPIDIVNLVDPDLRDQYPIEGVIKMAEVAVRCVQENPEARPDMKRVAYELDELMLLTQRWESAGRTTPGGADEEVLGAQLLR